MAPRYREEEKPMMNSTPSHRIMANALVVLLCCLVTAADDAAKSTSNDTGRILFRKALPQGLSVETNTLGPYRYVLVHFRELAGDFANRDSSLGDWSPCCLFGQDTMVCRVFTEKPAMQRRTFLKSLGAGSVVGAATSW